MTPTYRGIRRADMPFVMTTWMRGARQGRLAIGVPHRLFVPGQRAVAERLLARHGAVIACDPDDDDVLWGWACAGGGALHWIFVKWSLRHAGIGRGLLHAAGMGGGELLCSHYTREMERFHCRAVEYDPYLLTRWSEDDATD